MRLSPTTIQTLMLEQTVFLSSFPIRYLLLFFLFLLLNIYTCIVFCFIFIQLLQLAVHGKMEGTYLNIKVNGLFTLNGHISADGYGYSNSSGPGAPSSGI